MDEHRAPTDGTHPPRPPATLEELSTRVYALLDVLDELGKRTGSLLQETKNLISAYAQVEIEIGVLNQGVDDIFMQAREPRVRAPRKQNPRNQHATRQHEASAPHATTTDDAPDRVQAVEATSR